MFLRSNARSGGLTDRGQPMQATYVAVLDGERIRGVAAHCWNGMVLVQAPDAADAPAVAREAVRRSRRTVTGFSGPWSQVVAAREALGLGAAPTAKDSRDELYVLDLARLVVPPELASGALRCRHPAERELELLVDWRVRFAVEALGATDGPDLRQASTDDVRLQHERGTDCLLLGIQRHAPGYRADRRRVDTTRVPGPRLRPLRGGRLAARGAQARDRARGAVRRSGQRGRPAGVPVPRVPDRGGLRAGAAGAVARRVGKPHAPIDTLHPRIVLQQPEEGIPLRVDEDAVVLVARPVQELERDIHAPEARGDNRECGRLHVLSPRPREELVAARVHLGQLAKGAVAHGERRERPGVTSGRDHRP